MTIVSRMATATPIGMSLLRPSARLEPPTATTKRISSVAYAVDEMASEENTASAMVFGMRWCSISVVASGRPTSTRLTNATSSVPPSPGNDRQPTACHPAPARHRSARAADRGSGPPSTISSRAVSTGTLGARRRRETSVHVVVVGCGRVGSELALGLERSGHSVAVIDKNADAFRKRLPEDFAGQKVVGFGFDRDHLIEAGIERAGAVAAVTSGDNSNILTARIARENFAIDRVVARIYDPRRALIYQRLGIPTVATVSWTTDQVMRRLLPAEEQPHEWLDPSGKVCLLDYPIPAKWAGKKLAPLSEPGVFWLVAITRLGAAQVSTPSAIGQDGAILHFAADVSALDTLRHRLEHGEEHH